jgi:hypothetical protein
MKYSSQRSEMISKCFPYTFFTSLKFLVFLDRGRLLEEPLIKYMHHATSPKTQKVNKSVADGNGDLLAVVNVGGRRAALLLLIRFVSLGFNSRAIEASTSPSKTSRLGRACVSSL